MLETKVAMSTKLNCKASQEPEFWCFLGSTSNPQEPNPKAQTTPSKSPNLFLLTNPRLLAIPNPPNKSTITGNLNMAQSGPKNHELEHMIFHIAPQSPASNNSAINLIPTERSQPATNNNLLISKFTPANYS